MKANADKRNFLVSTKVYQINIVANNNMVKTKINEVDIESSPQEKLLGVTLDDQLSFKSHMNTYVKKPVRNWMLLHISSSVDLPECWVIMKAYINSQFGYFPLVWMMQSRSINNKINHIHEWTPRIVYKDKFSTFENLLEKDKAVKIYVPNL